MAKTFKSLIELEAYMNLRFAEALDNTMERLLIKLRELIDENVYGWESPAMQPWGLFHGETLSRTSGQRTGEFYDSWQRSKSVIMGNMITGEISQAVEMLHQYFRGGHIVHEDADELAGIIENRGLYNFGYADGVDRDYWSPFKEYVELNLEKIWVEECVKLGLPISSGISGVFK